MGRGLQVHLSTYENQGVGFVTVGNYQGLRSATLRLLIAAEGITFPSPRQKRLRTESVFGYGVPPERLGQPPTCNGLEMIAPVPFRTSATTRASTESRGCAPDRLSTSS